MAAVPQTETYEKVKNLRDFLTKTLEFCDRNPNLRLNKIDNLMVNKIRDFLESVKK